MTDEPKLGTEDQERDDRRNEDEDAEAEEDGLGGLAQIAHTHHVEDGATLPLSFGAKVGRTAHLRQVVVFGFARSLIRSSHRRSVQRESHARNLSAPA